MRTAHEILASNLKRLMRDSANYKKQTALAKASKVAQTSISNMTRPLQNKPKIDQVDKVAGVFGMQAWHLLLDEETIGDKLFEMLFRPRERALSSKKTNKQLAEQ